MSGPQEAAQRSSDQRSSLPGRPPDELSAGAVTLVRYRGHEAPELARVTSADLDHLRPWMPWAASTSLEEDQALFISTSVAEFDAGRAFNYWMREEATAELVGGAGLHHRVGERIEIGYWVRSDRTRRGYATSAAAALTDAALVLPGVRRVEIHCDEANRASAAVPRKLGYRLDRISDDDITALGQTGRSMVWIVDAGTWSLPRWLTGTS